MTLPGTLRHCVASPTLAPALCARRSAGERSGVGGQVLLRCHSDQNDDQGRKEGNPWRQ
jgi:hypothetical protein